MYRNHSVNISCKIQVKLYTIVVYNVEDSLCPKNIEGDKYVCGIGYPLSFVLFWLMFIFRCSRNQQIAGLNICTKM